MDIRRRAIPPKWSAVSRRIPVFVEPIAQRSLADAWIDTVDVADRITAGATFMATVNVMSQHDGAGELELRSAETILVKRPVVFRKGLTAIPIEATVDAPGPYVLEAALSVKGDALAANNTYSKETWADPRREFSTSKAYCQCPLPARAR